MHECRLLVGEKGEKSIENNQLRRSGAQLTHGVKILQELLISEVRAILFNDEESGCLISADFVAKFFQILANKAQSHEQKKSLF